MPINGLGEPVADQATVSFQILTTAPTNAQSSTNWTAVGPTSIGDGTSLNGYAGQVSSIAVDPSDPSGNTVYAAGASGGVWKTTNFLTTNPNGPTWIPLTDFGPTSGLNIGSIAVFGRNNDPSQSIIIAATGVASATYGIGGNDHARRRLPPLDGRRGDLDAARQHQQQSCRLAQDHLFAQTNATLGTVAGGTSAYKVVVDPNPTPTGGVIIYAALGGLNGGLWRSVDTGQTWQMLSTTPPGGIVPGTTVQGRPRPTWSSTSAAPPSTRSATRRATSTSSTPPSRASGTQVYSSPNRGQTLNPMTGSNFDAFIQMDRCPGPNGQPKQVPLANSPNPIGRGPGHARRAHPLAATVPNADVENTLYEGWLYAAVANPDGTLAGLFMTKDNGATWTQIQTPTIPSTRSTLLSMPSRPTTRRSPTTTSSAVPRSPRATTRSASPSIRSTPTSSTSAAPPTARPRA